MAHARLPNEANRRICDLLYVIEDAKQLTHSPVKRDALVNMTTQLVTGILEGVEGSFFEVLPSSEDIIVLRIRGSEELIVKLAVQSLSRRARARIRKT